MLRTKITKATLTILALFFTASASYSQEQKVPTYVVPGDNTVYTLRPDPRALNANNLVPVADATAPNPTTSGPISYFHLEFVVKAIDSGKVTSSRTYTMDANTDRSYHASYRSETMDASPGNGNHTNSRTNIDCNDVHLVGTDSLSFVVGTSINTESRAASPGPESILNATYTGSFYTLAAFGKPTVVFSADVQAPNRKIQMEVTATPIRISAKP